MDDRVLLTSPSIGTDYHCCSRKMQQEDEDEENGVFEVSVEKSGFLRVCNTLSPSC